MSEENNETSVIDDGLPQYTSLAGNPDSRKEVHPDRAALVKRVLEDIASAKKHWAKPFQRMRDDMKFANGKQWPGDSEEEKYTANIVQRHVQQRVSSLYAKNPKAMAKKRQTLDFTIWDESPESLNQALQESQPPVDGAPPDMVKMAQAQALIQDVNQGMEKRKMRDRIGRTLEILFHHYITEPSPPFKLSAKQLVRRVVTCGVGYVKLGFQRVMGKDNPDLAAKINDFSMRLATIDRLKANVNKGENIEAEREELKLALQALEKEAEVIVREGLIFSFPKSTAIIPDPETIQIKGWVGTGWVAEEYYFTPDKIKEIYNVDIGREFTGYSKEGVKSDKKCSLALVYEYCDKSTGLMYTACEGYCDFLCEPSAPPVEIDQFFPHFPLSINDMENEDEIFPLSDVHLLRHPQKEFNRSRQALRDHRKANAPQYATSAAIDTIDEDKLKAAVPHEVIKLLGLTQGMKIGDVIQMIQKAAIDPALYDTEHITNDILLIVGSQEANLGPTSGATATESSIAEGSRLSTQASAIDDLDDMLCLLARASGQVMLKELTESTVKKIAGPGAVWPSLSGQEISEELWLEIECGSSGRPNKAQDLQNWNLMLPHLMQFPGVSANFLTRETIKRLDDKLDITDAYLESMPSIQAQNEAHTAEANKQEQPQQPDPTMVMQMEAEQKAAEMEQEKEIKGAEFAHKERIAALELENKERVALMMEETARRVAEIKAENEREIAAMKIEAEKEMTLMQAGAQKDTAMYTADRQAEVARMGVEAKREADQANAAVKSEATHVGADTARHATEVGADTSRHATETGAATAKETAKVSADTAKETAKTGAEASKATAKIGAAAKSDATKKEEEKPKAKRKVKFTRGPDGRINGAEEI